MRPDETRVNDDRLYALLEAVDDPVPAVSVQEVMRHGASRRSRGGRWAAGLVGTLLAAGAVYAAQGLPIGDRERAPASVEEPGRASGQEGRSGVAVPVGDMLTVRIQRQTSGVVRIALVDGHDLTVESLSGRAAFDSGIESLEVRSDGTPDYLVSIPRTAPRVVVLAGDLEVLASVRGVVTTLAEPTGPDYVFDFTSGR